VDRRFAAGELENFDRALAGDDAVDAPLHVGDGDRVELCPGDAGRGIGKARRARKVAGVDDLDEGEAGRERFERALATACRVSAQCAGAAIVRCAAGRAAATGILRLALGQPVEAGIAGDANGARAVLGAVFFEEDLCTPAGADADHFGRRGLAADGQRLVVRLRRVSVVRSRGMINGNSARQHRPAYRAPGERNRAIYHHEDDEANNRPADLASNGRILP